MMLFSNPYFLFTISYFLTLQKCPANSSHKTKKGGDLLRSPPKPATPFYPVLGGGEYRPG